jgi:hypothetical protein
VSESPVLMKCGCVSHGLTKWRYPDGTTREVRSCSIHNCEEVATEVPDLTSRVAKCTYKRRCKKTSASNIELAFFRYCKDAEFDEYYCGCQGWD